VKVKSQEQQSSPPLPKKLNGVALPHSNQLHLVPPHTSHTCLHNLYLTQAGPNLTFTPHRQLRQVFTRFLSSVGQTPLSVRHLVASQAVSLCLQCSEVISEWHSEFKKLLVSATIFEPVKQAVSGHWQWSGLIVLSYRRPIG